MKTLSVKFSRFPKGAGCVRFVIGGVISIVALGLIGVVYQNLSMARDSELYPPPGQLVDVGGYRLHLYCIGEGSPTMVLEAGLGGKGVIAWSLVQDQMAAATRARICSYDRAGLAGATPTPSTSQGPVHRLQRPSTLYCTTQGSMDRIYMNCPSLSTSTTMKLQA